MSLPLPFQCTDILRICTKKIPALLTSPSLILVPIYSSHEESQPTYPMSAKSLKDMRELIKKGYSSFTSRETERTDIISNFEEAENFIITITRMISKSLMEKIKKLQSDFEDNPSFKDKTCREWLMQHGYYLK